MSSEPLSALTAADGPAAPPRSNGELVFEAPWESRAFGVAIALHDAGAIDYEEFRARLIAEIAEHEGAHGAARTAATTTSAGSRRSSRCSIEHEIVSADELDERAAEIAHAWAHDHDHDHSHDARQR